MFPFWNLVLAPLLEAAGASRVVEIGALRGDNTRQIIDAIGPGTELHVIDPSPGFDPTEHEQAFGGQYVFHRALSVDVLGALPPMDVALIDGDHNWYTVHEELRLLSEVARTHRRPLPLLVLHDVGWPYGRRDLYYDPDTIPEEFRQPHRRAGMRLGRSELVDQGGMSAGHWNAETEGGPRNGVMTALEDFLAGYDRPFRKLVLPLYFGLAVVADHDLLKQRPALAAVLDRLETPATKDALIELGESIRVRSVAHNHTLLGQRDERLRRLAERYVDGVVATILNEHRLEGEFAVGHLLDATAAGTPPNLAAIADPTRRSPVATERLREERRTGRPDHGDPPVSDLSLTTVGRVGLEALDAVLTEIRGTGVAGDVVVVGAGRGGSGILARAHLEAYDEPRHVWLADPFTADGPGSLNRVRDTFHRFSLLDDQVHFLQGAPAATLPEAPPEEVALLVIGSADPADVQAALTVLHPRLPAGGRVVIERQTDATAAVAREFRDSLPPGSVGPVIGLGALGTTWAVLAPGAAAGTDHPAPAARSAGLAHAPLARPVADPVDLSMVVVFHNMKREAVRTLRSLSRSYQRQVEDLDYEVVVVENGSAPDQKLGAELVASFGPEFRYLDMGDDALPSPAHALNVGIAASRGDHLGLMIDGAHVVTPGVLRYAMAGLTTYAPAVVATQAWYVGPGQQGEAMRGGYDQAYEDQLFDQIGWPAHGYRLFEIGHFVGDRDWLEGLWESNCLFARRKQLEQVGGFDEGFAMPGGGYTNLDLYERLASAPDVELVTILGEGSFHQVHGGTTTNLIDPTERRTTVRSYTDHYRELRGRPFGGPEKPLRLVGSFETNESKRTRSRRITAAAFDVDPGLEGDDGPLGSPVPVPEDQRDAFIKAYWRSHAWRRLTWLGSAVRNAPTDLLTYQEIIAEVRPDWVIDLGDREGGRSRFLADVCQLVGHGRVVAVNNRFEPDAPDHDGLIRVEGPRHLEETAERVRAITGPDPHGLVILGGRSRRNQVRAEFDLYAPFVAVGSYAVVEHTMLNGWPVDGSFGRGPFEAVRGILASRSDFVVDTEREKHSLTFNPFGFLRRIT